MNCPNCGSALSERGFFCKVCASQVRCMTCREILEQGAAACVECGTKVGARQVNGLIAPAAVPVGAVTQRNTLTYHEDKNSRSFEASLTDPAMQGLGDVLGEFFAQRGAARTAQPNGHFRRGQEILSPKALPPSEPAVPAEDYIEPQLPPAVQVTGEENPAKAQLLKVLSVKGNSFELIDNRLKAKSALDYVRRLTYIFLFAHETFGKPHPTEAAVKVILQSAKSWDASGNANTWLKKRIGIADEGEDRLKLTAPGREGAIATLKDALDANVPDAWNPDKNAPKQRGARKKKA